MLDILIKNGIIVDGSGKDRYVGDVGISSDRIVSVGPVLDSEAAQVIDASGLIVCPGFIDNHSHSEANVFADPLAHNIVGQGITTEIGGNCGHSIGPSKSGVWTLGRGLFPQLNEEEISDLIAHCATFGDYMNYIDIPMATNIYSYVGHGQVRAATMGFADRPPTLAEMEQMKAYVTEAMEAGAMGLSSGLAYAPGSYASKEEVAELCRIVAAYGGNYTSHIRNYGNTIDDAVREAIWIGETAGVPVVISHLYIAGKRNWGRSDEILGIVAEARQRGVDVHIDQRAYRGGCSRLMASIPLEDQVGGFEAFKQRIASRELRDHIKNKLQSYLDGAPIPGKLGNHFINCGGPDGILLGYIVGHPEYRGHYLSEMAKELGQDPYELMFDILQESGGDSMAVYNTASEEDVQNIMKQPDVMVSCDTEHATEIDINGHPGSFANYPRVMAHYVRDLGLLTLESAIYKSTGLPAGVTGIPRKGLLAPDYDADVVIFDYEHLKTNATDLDPRLPNEGFKYVIINGKIALKDDVCSDVLSGRLLRFRGRH